MTEITDAKKWLDDGQQIENSIYNIVSHCIAPVARLAIPEQMGRVQEVVKEYREILRCLPIEDNNASDAKLRQDLRHMILRLEAAIMYAKNHFKLNEQ
jgi:hypothetical protein